LPELHIWSPGKADCAIEIRPTQPNTIQPRAELLTGRGSRRLEPAPVDSGGFEIRLSVDDIEQLAVSPPNWSGNFLALDILHTLHDANELRYWGWTYRFVRENIPLLCAADAKGERLVLDSQGWLMWPRQRLDFGEVVTILDQISIEIRA
jgi:hypothetical protein